MDENARLAHVALNKVHSCFKAGLIGEYSIEEWDRKKLIYDLLSNQESIAVFKHSAGNTIKYIRKNIFEVTQEELGAYLGVERNTISAWENGENNIPSNQLIKIADLFRLSLDVICLREDYLKEKGVINNGII
ncbi:helix-turn-helix domain-containing protein [Listeria seeligeri]|uniref:helix-turn-helix domain-containing protein n=1 Tax=Listeria seeligeri TaxID=1640 RepID=UPI0010D66560|nr:helix-turn-helix transcriptional regulator [Listeria seeligeri]MBC1597289.1 helix-turn-helix transcriptional regulator [Listeria seeligeri]MBC1737240.1 helix-turn-helix transcriptional regulator [Listeria seeligeri]MBF2458899.1 helix-turn-helix transcriptional regulator [Listeria seeligeri]MBF2539456.1 helix-turn-helix transcriptional regulator [Listeria seeligeri]MBF2549134.1 helix-turn-helix transcriptional regulator [Listeria seeligeri]